MRYKGEGYSFGKDRVVNATSEDVINDFVCHSDYNSNAPGIESRLTRLTDLVARICDQQKVDLTKLLSNYETKMQYTVDDTPDSD